MPSATIEPADQQPLNALAMASESTLSRRCSRPSKVQTDLGLQAQAIAVCARPPESPESQSSSPLMCAEPEELITTASLRSSSDDLVPLASRSLEDLDASDIPFRLQEPAFTPSASTLSRRTSTASLTPAALKSPSTSAMGEVMKGLSSLSRRSSNSFRRVNSIVGRRPSSSHPRSRDGSVGPGVMRRRGSTSTPNLPFDHNALYTDSDDDCAVEKDDAGSMFGDAQSGTTASSTASGSTAVTTGPVIPEVMLNGTTMTKVGKRKNLKRITLSYDPKAVKIFWDRNKSSKAIYIDDIKEILTAEDIGQYRLDSGLDESSASKFFSILYTRQGQAATRTFHVVTDDTETLAIWTNTLEDICKRRQAFATSLMAFDDRALKKWWLNETTKLSGNDKIRPFGGMKTDSLGIEHVCRSLHIHIPAQELRARIEAVKGQRGTFDRLVFPEFLEFVRHLKTRKDIQTIYRQVAENSEKGVTKDEFFRFLRDVQHENVDDELTYWENIFVYHVCKGRPRDADKILGIEEGLAMSEAGFASFLTSHANSAILKEPVHDYKLDRPMSEYYISSSHNTYLLGRQVKGVSSTEGYVSALSRGCRCIEIDCWDGPNDEPIVMHGRSWTTRISFMEVLKTINKHAFLKSRFPLWISLEVRCNFTTQANMAKMMIEIFGDKLVREPITKNPDRLPSPSDLLGRILIKVKQAHTQVHEPLRRRGNSLPSPYQRPLALDNTPIPSSPLLSPTPFSRSNRQVNTPNTITEGEVHDLPSSSPSECESDSEKDSSSKKSASKINPVLGELGVYCVGIQFEGFDTPEAKKYNHIFSFKEKTFAEKSQPGEPKRKLYCHNMRYMMRVYPNGSRISSSNFDPLIYWKRGVQMAALNWQTFDTGMQINQAMFDGGTDQSGYVLKPIEGREFKLMPDVLPSEIVGKRPRKHVSFTINVISAQQLMKPFNLGDRRSMDPYVEVEVLLADDKRNKGEAAASGQAPELKFRTKIARENGFNPSFGDAYEFDITTKYPDLIFVRFNVKLADKSYNDRTPMATFTAKLSSLNQGYRTIPLHNQWGERFTFSTLFCHIKKEKPTDIMVDYSEEPSRNGNKLNRIGKVVRSAPSPKTSIESSRSS